MSQRMRVPMRYPTVPRRPKPKNIAAPWRLRTSCALLQVVSRLTDPWCVLGYALVATHLSDDDEILKFFDHLADKQAKALSD